MDRLQELVRLHRMGTGWAPGAREVARLLRMGLPWWLSRPDGEHSAPWPRRPIAPRVRSAEELPIDAVRSYGMGLMLGRPSGIPVAYHLGSMVGYKANLVWLPEHGVGAVILANSDPGDDLVRAFPRKLLEVLFDGAPEADATITAAADAIQVRSETARKVMTVPPDPAEVAKLAPRYTSRALGELRVTTTGDTTTFDLGEFKSPVASRKNPDGTASFITTAPGFTGVDFVVGTAAGKRTLIVRSAQQDYVFGEHPYGAEEDR